MPRIVPQETPLDSFGRSFGQSFVGTGQAHLDRIQQEAYQKARLDMAREGLDLEMERFNFQQERQKTEEQLSRELGQFRAGQLGGGGAPVAEPTVNPRIEAARQLLPRLPPDLQERLMGDIQEEEGQRIFQEGIAKMGQGASAALEKGSLSPEAYEEIMRDLSTVQDPNDLVRIEKRIWAAQDEQAKILADEEDRQAYANVIDRQIKEIEQLQAVGGKDSPATDAFPPEVMTRVRQIKHKVLNGRLGLEEAKEEMDRIHQGGDTHGPAPIEVLQAGDNLPVNERYQPAPPLQGGAIQQSLQPSPTPSSSPPEMGGSPVETPEYREKKSEWRRGRNWERLSPDERSGFADKVAEMMLAGARREEVGDYLLSVDVNVETLSPPDALAIKRLVEAKMQSMTGEDLRPGGGKPFGASDLERILKDAGSR